MTVDDSFDDEDWVELTPSAFKPNHFPDVAISLKLTRFKSVRAMLTFRGKAKDRLEAAGMRYRVAIGGRDADRIKLTPDLVGGLYETRRPGKSVDVFLLNIGSVSAWPAEVREKTSCEWKPDAVGGGLIVVLPARLHALCVGPARRQAICADGTQNPS